ncbi:MAG: response regulator [Candidatus Scalindua sp.]|jgi:two-component system chemotaxis response regulator CheY|nr:response regulator [Candidatus Scalindua sp.]MBT5303924.1 response regulator [Candidatus Scalindua sp.]MBT6047817.1 response regulator [Candidatus Scalindua sp.]MBT6564005.1 response regulator [Candidatus Scalindua sp.]MBT7210590.1 response regulator [Candidatus Scalindua sp.]
MDSSLQNDQDDLKKAVNEKRILVVDDDEPVRVIIKSLLEDAGLYSVQTAQDGEAAINLLKQQTFDLLITDYDMPKMNGYELFKRCRVISSELPVLFITGNNFNEGVIETINSQDNVDCIYKPFNAEDLFKIVEKLIRMDAT